MKQSIIRWSMYAGAFFVAGPVAGAMVASVRSSDGGPDASLLASAAPVWGSLVGLGAMAIASAMGLAAAKLTSARAGMVTAGLTLAWAAWRAGDVEAILRTAQSPSPLWRLAIEGVVLGVPAVALMVAMHAVAHREHHELVPGEAPGLGRVIRETLAMPSAMVGVLAAIVGGGAAAWIVANSGMKGQTVGAAWVAGIAGAAVGRLADNRAPAAVFMVPAAVLAVICPVAAALAQGSDIVPVVNAGGLYPVARLAPLDWIAGALLGVPIGLGWTASMVDKRS